MSDHAIGSRISLVSKSEIRYEGYLDFINPVENTVGLKNVVMHGTEGRRNGINEVPASTTAYDFIIFRGADIKDLTVYEDEPQDPAILSRGPIGLQQQPQITPQQQQQQTQQQQQQPAPAVVQPQQQQQQQIPPTHQQQQQHHQQQQQQPSHVQRDRRDDRSHGGRRDDYHHHHNNNNNNNYRGGYNDRRGGYYGDGNRDGGRGGRGHRGGGYGGNHSSHNNNNNNNSRQEYHTGRDFQPVPPAAKEKLEEFDFAKSREEFERHRAEFEKARAEVKSESTRRYDKSTSFFDNISNETRDRRGGGVGGPRINRDEQRRADTETFGSEMVGQMRGFRRGRGGRGRYGHRF